MALMMIGKQQSRFPVDAGINLVQALPQQAFLEQLFL